MRYKYESDCVTAEIEIEIDEEDAYAVIDDGIVYVTPSYRFYKDGKLVTYPLTEGTFQRSSECTSLRREKERFHEFVKDVLSKHTVEKPLQEWVMEQFPNESFNSMED